jgi:hypothetical protein
MSIHNGTQWEPQWRCFLSSPKPSWLWLVLARSISVCFFPNFRERWIGPMPEPWTKRAFRSRGHSDANWSSIFRHLVDLQKRGRSGKWKANTICNQLFDQNFREGWWQHGEVETAIGLSHCHCNCRNCRSRTLPYSPYTAVASCVHDVVTFEDRCQHSSSGKSF